MPRGVYVKSESHRRNIALVHLGMRHSDETKLKMSLAKKGLPPHNKGNKKPFPKCLDCYKELGDYRSLRCRVCSGKFNGVKGRPSGRKGKKYPHLCGENHPRWKGGERAMRIRFKDRIRFWSLQRIARKRNAAGKHTLEEWNELKKNYNFMCLCCKRCEPEIKLTEDHVVPLSKGGSNYIENIQPLCGSCNSSKNAKTIDYRDLSPQVSLHLLLNNVK